MVSASLQQRAIEWSRKLEETMHVKPEPYKWRKVRVFSLRKGDRVNVEGLVYIVRDIEPNCGTVRLSLGLKGKAYRVTVASTALIDRDSLV